MNKNSVISAISAVIILGAIIFLTNKPYSPGPDNGGAVEPYRTTLSGEYLCLPHKETSGPQTMECAFGMKTDDGKYYALDFNLSSETPPEFAVGDRVEASGLVTPVEMLSTERWRTYPIEGIFSVTDSARKLEPVTYACHSDGMMCWDGSVVGRMGPKCEFTMCPARGAASATIHTTLGQKITGLNVSVTPNEIISDSRCPIDVQCVWAGTMEVRTVLETKTGHGEHTLKLGEPLVFGDYTVTFTEANPTPKANQKIPGSSYRFTFIVEKN